MVPPTSGAPESDRAMAARPEARAHRRRPCASAPGPTARQCRLPSTRSWRRSPAATAAPRQQTLDRAAELRREDQTGSRGSIRRPPEQNAPIASPPSDPPMRIASDRLDRATASAAAIPAATPAAPANPAIAPSTISTGMARAGVVDPGAIVRRAPPTSPASRARAGGAASSLRPPTARHTEGVPRAPLNEASRCREAFALRATTAPARLREHPTGCRASTPARRRDPAWPSASRVRRRCRARAAARAASRRSSSVTAGSFAENRRSINVSTSPAGPGSSRPCLDDGDCPRSAQCLLVAFFHARQRRSCSRAARLCG